MDTIKKQQQLKKQCIDYKGGKCSICGYNKYDGSLDFHHKNPSEKEFAISDWKNTSFDRIQKELDKCVLICRNCHGEEHDIVLKK